MQYGAQNPQKSGVFVLTKKCPKFLGTAAKIFAWNRRFGLSSVIYKDKNTKLYLSASLIQAISLWSGKSETFFKILEKLRLVQISVARRTSKPRSQLIFYSNN